jgi:hypothetical protein
MSDYESNPARYDDCLRAFVRGERAMDPGDLGAGLDWIHTALTGLIRFSEDTSHIPKNRRPRRLSMRANRREDSQASDTTHENGAA